MELGGAFEEGMETKAAARGTKEGICQRKEGGIGRMEPSWAAEHKFSRGRCLSKVDV